MADYTHPPEVCGTATNQEITDGVNAGIEKLGLDGYIASLALDCLIGHWHDWRVYAATIHKIAVAAVSQEKANG